MMFVVATRADLVKRKSGPVHFTCEMGLHVIPPQLIAAGDTASAPMPGGDENVPFLWLASAPALNANGAVPIAQKQLQWTRIGPWRADAATAMLNDAACVVLLIGGSPSDGQSTMPMPILKHRLPD